MHKGGNPSLQSSKLDMVRDEQHRSTRRPPYVEQEALHLALVWTSSAAKGSSINSTLGCIAKARATATRWRMPPESSCGRLSIVSKRPTR
jgi:hypothetical protein